jgi:hypothetical protein
MIYRLMTTNNFSQHILRHHLLSCHKIKNKNKRTTMTLTSSDITTHNTQKNKLNWSQIVSMNKPHQKKLDSQLINNINAREMENKKEAMKRYLCRISIQMTFNIFQIYFMAACHTNICHVIHLFSEGETSTKMRWWWWRKSVEKKRNFQFSGYSRKPQFNNDK